MFMQRSRKAFIAAALAAALIFSGGCGGKGNNIQEEKKPVPVSVAEVQKGSVANSTTVTGKVVANAEVIIIPKVGGRVTKVNVEVGSKVKAGELLVQLDTAELQAQLKQAEGMLASAKAGTAQYDLRLEDARKNLQKMEQLYKEGAVSKDQYDSALLQYNVLANSPPGPQVQQAQGNVDYIKAQIANASVRAPISGEISAKSVEMGELAGPSAPILTIVDTSKIFVEGVITEKDIGFVTSGQRVTVEIDALGGSFDGKIIALSPAADARTKGYQMKVEIEDPGGKVKPGMFAEVSIITQSKKDTLVVPKEALVARGDKRVVYVVKGDTAYEREVGIGMEDGTNVEVTKGLQEGDKVITLGQHSLSDKAKVKVKEESTR